MECVLLVVGCGGGFARALGVCGAVRSEREEGGGANTHRTNGRIL